MKHFVFGLADEAVRNSNDSVKFVRVERLFIVDLLLLSGFKQGLFHLWCALSPCRRLTSHFEGSPVLVFTAASRIWTALNFDCLWLILILKYFVLRVQLTSRCPEQVFLVGLDIILGGRSILISFLFLLWRGRPTRRLLTHVSLRVSSRQRLVHLSLAWMRIVSSEPASDWSFTLTLPLSQLGLQWESWHSRTQIRCQDFFSQAKLISSLFLLPRLLCNRFMLWYGEWISRAFLEFCKRMHLQ